MGLGNPCSKRIVVKPHRHRRASQLGIAGSRGKQTFEPSAALIVLIVVAGQVPIRRQAPERAGVGRRSVEALTESLDGRRRDDVARAGGKRSGWPTDLWHFAAGPGEPSPEAGDALRLAEAEDLHRSLELFD